MDYAALKTEITTDPDGYGYSGKSDREVANLMNEVREAIGINRRIISTHEVWGATVIGELKALSSGDQQIYFALLGMGTIDVEDANTRTAFADLFGAGTSTRTNLIALQTRDGSRAEQLGFGNVTHGDVARAKLL